MVYNTKVYYAEKGKLPIGDAKYKILDKVYKQIDEKDIWISYSEIVKHYRSVCVKINNQVIREAKL